MRCSVLKLLVLEKQYCLKLRKNPPPPPPPRWILVGLQTNKSVNQESNAAVFDHCNLTNMQVWLNHSRYPSLDMTTDFAKQQFAGLFKSFNNFASRYYGIDILLTDSRVGSPTFKSLYPIHANPYD